MRTAVRRVLLLSALMTPSALYALGLGEIKLNSALNQPFDAEIELVAATADDLGALRASLANGETFTRYGLDRPAFLTEFKFSVATAADGRDVLRVTSPRPVTEPFVTLLVEANWPRGRLLREYTVLLDPPVYAPGPAASAPVAAAPRVSSGGATSVRAEEQVARETEPVRPSPRSQAPAPAASIEPGSTYQVQRNDTLWEIARSASPGSRADVNRAMVSIFQNNPQAFDGNINVLRSGSTLRIPDSSQIQSISAAEASAEVARQYDAWRNGTASAAASSAQPESRLRLVPPEQGTAAPSTTTTTHRRRRRQRRLPRPPQAPTGDLQTRVQQLEAELAEAKRLLEVRNAELATLQGGTPAAPAEGTAAPAPETTTDAAPAEPVAAEPAAAEPPPPAVEPAPAPGPTLLERLLQYWWVLLGLLAVGLGALLFRSHASRARHG